MRFDKVIPKEKWTEEKTKERIGVVMDEIASFNKQMNKIDGQINWFNNKKNIIKRKVSYKWIYLRQLESQLNEM